MRCNQLTLFSYIYIKKSAPLSTRLTLFIHIIQRGYISSSAAKVLWISLNFTDVMQRSAPKQIKPTPVIAITVATPAPNGLMSIKTDSKSSITPPKIVSPLPLILKFSISPPKAKMMKLWYIIHIPSIIGKRTNVTLG